jgi:hypothetical protein
MHLATFVYDAHLHQIIGLPAGSTAERYDITGKANPEGQPSTEQLKVHAEEDAPVRSPSRQDSAARDCIADGVFKRPSARHTNSAMRSASWGRKPGGRSCPIPSIRTSSA